MFLVGLVASVFGLVGLGSLLVGLILWVQRGYSYSQPDPRRQEWRPSTRWW